MRYYYFWQQDCFREGSDDELKVYHMLYPPGDTKEEAIEHAISHFEEQAKYYQSIADRMTQHYNQACERRRKI